MSLEGIWGKFELEEFSRLLGYIVGDRAIVVDDSGKERRWGKERREKTVGVKEGNFGVRSR